MASRSAFPIVVTAFLATSAAADPPQSQAPSPSAAQTASLDGDYLSPGRMRAELRAAIERGELSDPAQRAIPPIPAARSSASSLGARGAPCLTPQQIFPYEDTQQLLLTNFTDTQLIDFMADAANAMMAAHGDLYDFVGFWANFTPHHLIGAAFYMPIANDVQGIGDPSTVGTPIFNDRPTWGLGGNRIAGFVMMWDVNTSYWQPGNGSNADFTRLALGQEFEHRFACFLPDLLDGRRLQGDDSACGRSFHWNWKVDGQGSAMELSEWVGSSPAVLQGSFVTFNTDIGGVFGFTDLYLMGYVSPAEMDAGNSQLRYMHSSNCSSNYFGAISSFSSADVVAAAGTRVPDSTTAQKDYRTGWIMIHRPGDAPDQAELSKAVAILDQHMADWSFGTLGRGTMDDSSFDDCNCNGVPDASDISSGASLDTNGDGIPDECQCQPVTYCTAKPSSLGCSPAIGASGLASVSSTAAFDVTATSVLDHKNGLFVYGTSGRAAIPFQGAFLCTAPPRTRTPMQSSGGSSTGPDCSGSFSFDFNAWIQAGVDPALVAGAVVGGQYWSRDPQDPLGFGTSLSDAVEFDICPR